MYRTQDWHVLNFIRSQSPRTVQKHSIYQSTDCVHWTRRGWHTLRSWHSTLGLLSLLTGHRILTETIQQLRFHDSDYKYRGINIQRNRASSETALGHVATRRRSVSPDRPQKFWSLHIKRLSSIPPRSKHRNEELHKIRVRLGLYGRVKRIDDDIEIEWMPGIEYC